jgi:hypothetical protein
MPLGKDLASSGLQHCTEDTRCVQFPFRSPSILYMTGMVFARGLQETFLVEYSLQIIRQGCCQVYDGPCSGMGELELIGVQKLALEC